MEWSRKISFNHRKSLRSKQHVYKIDFYGNQSKWFRKKKQIEFFVLFCSMRIIFQFDYMFEANWGERLTTKWSHKIIETESIQIEYHLELYTLDQKKNNELYLLQVKKNEQKNGDSKSSDVLNLKCSSRPTIVITVRDCKWKLKSNAYFCT